MKCSSEEPILRSFRISLDNLSAVVTTVQTSRRRLSEKVELAALNPAEEGAPSTGSKEKGRAGLVLAVPDRDVTCRQRCCLNAVAIAKAVAAFGPANPRRRTDMQLDVFAAHRACRGREIPIAPLVAPRFIR